jgi:hypothetical protein
MRQAATGILWAVVLVAYLVSPATASAAGPYDSGSYTDRVADADVVVVGRAIDASAGRVVNGCQLTGVTVHVEDVVLGTLPSPAPADLKVEFIGDCRTVGSLGDAIPTDRAVYFLVNKGRWLREHVVPTSGDWSAEDWYWRPLAPDQLAGDDSDHPSLDAYVDELRESEYLRSSAGSVMRPVGLGIWFAGQAYLLSAAMAVVAFAAAARALTIHRSVRRAGLVVAGLATLAAVAVFAGGPRLARAIDFAQGLAGRTEVVEAIRSGALAAKSGGEVVLPEGRRNLAIGGVVVASPTEPTMVFFHTQSFFSPDPYCGYEYAQIPDALDLDPLGSGVGAAEDLGHGWYWVCVLSDG